MNKNYIRIFLTGLLILLFSGLYAQTWYDSADVRIDQLRKGNFKIVILDEADNLYTDSVEISLVRHEFPWGTVIPLQGSENYVWGRAVALKYFNYGVTGNEFKWPWLEPAQGVTSYNIINEVLDWTEKVGFGYRGHTLLWGGSESWQMPSWTLNNTLTPLQVYNACETHIRRDVAYFKGRVDEYDVVNEPTHEKWLAQTVGDSINWNSFKWAAETDTNADLYVNDFNIIVWGSAPEYHAMIDTMLNHGAPIDGIGVQGHMEGSINWSDIKTKLDFMSDLGLPIRVTEFDMKIDENHVSEQQQAVEYAEMMRTIFSHPSINGFIFWSFCDNSVFRAGSGFYTENRIPKIAADTVYNLIHKNWSTHITIPAELNDTFAFRGFYGNYKIQVDYGSGKKREFDLAAMQRNEDSVFVLRYNDGMALTPKLNQANLTKDGKAVEIKFSRAIDPQTIKKNEFHIFMGTEVSIDSVVSGSIDSTTYLIYLNEGIKYRQYVSVLYNGQTASTVDGAFLYYFGPETVVNDLPGFRFAESDSTGKFIIVGLSQKMQSNIPVNQFSIIVDGEAVSILSADYDEDGNIVFELVKPVNYNQLITITCTKGTFASTDGYILDSFGPKYVQNNVMQPVDAISEVEVSRFKIYPNPADDLLYVYNIEDLNNIEIYSVEGKFIQYSIVSSNQSTLIIDIKDLMPGSYFCNFHDDKGNYLGSKKFIKVKE